MVNDMRVSSGNMPKSCASVDGDGLTGRECTPIRVGEKKGRKSAVTWLGAEKETESTRRDAGRLSERGWL